MTLTDVLVLTSEHPEFPVVVRAMSQPPEKLYLRGRLPQGHRTAVVGTRRATAPALSFTRELAAETVRAGGSIWSGGALGIDTAAHEGALEAGGTTVVVMGTGFDHPYPATNRRMFERVVEQGGAWLSLFPPDHTGSRWTFLARNELLASLVSDVVVVQAPARSGARSTTAAARRMGKEVWAVPAAPWDVNGAGCLAEIAAGARVVTAPSQLGPPGSPLAKPRRSRLPAGLSDAERRVVRAVTGTPANLDDICLATGLPLPDASSAALTLTLGGVLLEGADGRYYRS